MNEEKKKNTKSTDAELNIRVLTVYELILKGHGRPDIVRYVAKMWNASSRTADKYIMHANEIIESYAIEIKDNLIKKQTLRLEKLLAKAFEANDIHASLDVVKEVSKLFDIYPDPRMRHVFDGKIEVDEKADLSKLTEADLNALANKLIDASDAEGK